MISEMKDKLYTQVLEAAAEYAAAEQESRRLSDLLGVCYDRQKKVQLRLAEFSRLLAELKA
jgi:hypothetical protein